MCEKNIDNNYKYNLEEKDFYNFRMDDKQEDENELLSYSMVIDDKHQNNKEEELLSVSPRQPVQWIADDKVTTCHKCKKFFSFMRRKHHCRRCGRAFCYECSSKSLNIPDNVSTSRYDSNYHSFVDKYVYWDKKRVCDDCYEKIENINKLQNDLKLLQQIDLCIDDYILMSNDFEAWEKELFKLQKDSRYKHLFTPNNFIFDDFRSDKNKNKIGISNIWKQIGKEFLSAFRGIQYYLPDHKFGPLDKKILWNNRKYIINHSKYSVQLIRCYIHDETKLEEILLLYYNSLKLSKDNFNKKTVDLPRLQMIQESSRQIKTCKELMCSRNCNGSIHHEDLLTIWREKVTNVNLIKFLVKHAENIDDNVFIGYLPIIISQIQNNKDCNIIQDYILTRINDNIRLINHVYWDLKLLLLHHESNIYRKFLNRLKQEINKKTFEQIVEGEILVTILQSIPEKLKSQENIKKFIEAKLFIRNIRNPIDLEHSCEIDIDKLIIKPSITKPLILSFNNTNKECKTRPIKKMLYKTEDIRKDLLVMNVIRLIHKIAKTELNIDTNFITYDMIPTSNNTGVIEIVENCETIKNIRETYKITILNYIMNHNKNKSVEEVRLKFMHSCAMACIITYILGIGDRHLDNIMVDRNGELFHIDYSYILGYDPKPFTKPQMRISDDMIDALGGINSEAFKEFQKICTKIYNCLRRHVNLFINIMTFINEMLPPIDKSEFNLSNEKIISELLSRLAPGECYQEAKLHVVNVIDNNSKVYNQLHYTFIDFLHKHSQDKTVNRVLSSTYSETSSYINYFVGAVSNYFNGR